MRISLPTEPDEVTLRFADPEAVRAVLVAVPEAVGEMLALPDAPSLLLVAAPDALTELTEGVPNAAIFLAAVPEALSRTEALPEATTKPFLVTVPLAVVESCADPLACSGSLAVVPEAVAAAMVGLPEAPIMQRTFPEAVVDVASGVPEAAGFLPTVPEAVGVGASTLDHNSVSHGVVFHGGPGANARSVAISRPAQYRCR
jgi:hypothetical protein